MRRTAMGSAEPGGADLRGHREAAVGQGMLEAALGTQLRRNAVGDHFRPDGTPRT